LLNSIGEINFLFSLEEKELINNIQNGDRKAYDTFVQKYQGLVVNTCYGYLFNREDAEDLAQDIFIDVYTGIKNFKAESKISTWLYRIAINKSIDYIRKKKRIKRFGHLTSIFTNEGNTIEIQDNTENPQNTIEQSERIKILNIAISKLPQNQNTAIRLSKFEGLASKEIAEIMDLSNSAVESLLHRSKTNLRSMLQKYYDGKL